jgi:hypothetical protein
MTHEITRFQKLGIVILLMAVPLVVFVPFAVLWVLSFLTADSQILQSHSVHPETRCARAESGSRKMKRHLIRVPVSIRQSCFATR